MTTATERRSDPTVQPPRAGDARPVTEVDATTVRDWLAKGQALVVDVREADEHARERLAAATLAPLSRFDAATVHSVLPSEAPGRLVLLCRSGRRASEAAGRLATSGSLPGVELFVLRGGIEAWKSSGLPVLMDRAVPISIMRQVQLVVGSAVLLFSALAIAVSPWFAAVPAAMGAGLIFAGSTGACGMATMLAWMPWNKAIRGASCTASKGGSCAG